MAARRNQDRYAATFSFVYGGTPLDEGQVIGLRGLDNDPKLVQHRYLVEVPARAETWTCGVCGAEFLYDWQRRKHGAMRHAETERMADEGREQLREARRHPDLQHPDSA